MSRSVGRTIAHAALGIAMIGGAVAGVVVLLHQGLDDADKIASVVAMIAGVAALVVGVWQLRLALRPSAASTSGHTLHVSGNIGTSIVGDRTVNVITNQRPRDEDSSS